MAKVFSMIPVQDAHLVYVACHMRREERDEVWASDGMPPLDVLRQSFKTSVMSFTAVDDDGTPVFVWGVTEGDERFPEWHCLWFIGTIHVCEPLRWRKFLRTCRHYLPMTEERFPKLFNWIDARYEKSLNWALWLGGQIRGKCEYGAAKLPFYLVTHER